MRLSNPSPTPFARRLFALICLWLALSVVLGVMRAPGGRQPFEQTLAAAPGWPAR
jgi:hypothetical protein